MKSQTRIRHREGETDMPSFAANQEITYKILPLIREFNKVAGNIVNCYI